MRFFKKVKTQFLPGAKIQTMLNDIISTNLREWALIPLNFSEILLSVQGTFHYGYSLKVILKK